MSGEIPLSPGQDIEAVVVSGVVTDLVVVAGSWTPPAPAQGISTAPFPFAVQIGATWDGTTFTNPPPPVTPTPLTPQQVAQAILAGSDASSVLWRGLIVILANKFNMTPAAVTTALVNAAN